MNLFPKTFLLLALLPHLAFSQISITIPKKDAVGIISRDSLEHIGLGTGFLIDGSTMLTCAHVTDTLTKCFYGPYGERKTFRMKRKWTLPAEDLALFESETPITDSSFLHVNNSASAKVGDWVFYLGFDVATNSLVAHVAQICS